MRIVTLGGGPAGLYFSLLMKKVDPDHQVTVVERNPPDATYGWGVVFSEETLGALRDADLQTFEEIQDSFAKWNAIDVHYRDRTIRSRGHAFSAISRVKLLNILQRRCADLEVDLQFLTEVTDPQTLLEADLVVGADGVNSVVRGRFADRFLPALDVHTTRFVWFGTDLVFKAFTFIFRENEHGLFQVHAYPFDAQTSTFIVECPESTWARAGLDGATEVESIAYCEKLFADDLAGHSLLSNRSLWINFITVKNQTWHHRNVVLLGDSAHTAHFTIGSGTKLAMEDAVALSEALRRHANLETALTDFEMERQPVVERFQEAALESSAYFENVSRYATFDPIQFAFNLLTRSGRITHLELEKRDPDFVARVDGWFAANATGDDEAEDVIARPPMFSPLILGGTTIANRVVVSPTGEDDAAEGEPSAGHAERLLLAARSAAGLVLTEPVAVSAHARITPGTPGLYEDRHGDAWRRIVEEIHRIPAARVAIRLVHAGARGATRPRRWGVDRPLRDGAWPLLAPSAVPYTRGSQVPHPMTADKMQDVRDDFVRAAERAAEAGFDLLELDMGHGYLLASFLSPLTNRRSDAYGGSLENRMRYPLEVMDAVRAVWPGDRPLGARLNVTDWAAGGFDVDEAVWVSGVLGEHGCDLIEVAAGQTIEHDKPQYGRFFLVPYSDRVRNEASIHTLASGGLTTADEINTILAAGRADLCVLDRRAAPGR
ncbi:MAG: FAD-dependent monooxygenase [Actinomycetota bacterium]